MKFSFFASVVASALAISPLVRGWQVQTFTDADDQTCSGTPNVTLTDLPPGECTSIPHPVNSVLFSPDVGNGPFTGTNEIDFYPGQAECEGDYNSYLFYGLYDTDPGDCDNAEFLQNNDGIQYYKVWKR